MPAAGEGLLVCDVTDSALRVTAGLASGVRDAVDVGRAETDGVRLALLGGNALRDKSGRGDARLTGGIDAAGTALAARSESALSV